LATVIVAGAKLQVPQSQRKEDAGLDGWFSKTVTQPELREKFMAPQRKTYTCPQKPTIIISSL